jgi:hypothetical protein
VQEAAGAAGIERSLFALPLRRPATVAALAVVLCVAVYQLWITPANPPGFHRDEASVAYHAYSLSRDLRDQDGGLLPLYIVSF